MYVDKMIYLPAYESPLLDKSNQSESNLRDDLDLKTPESLQWDEEGTELLSSDELLFPTDLHAVANLDHLLPLNFNLPIISYHETPPMDEPINLDNVIPASSTPRERSRRIQQRRRTLPLESSHRQSFLQSFLRRLNPFKKKT